MVSNPPFIGYLGHVEGVPQPYLGDLLTMVINHVSKSWDDPPSGPMMKTPVPRKGGTVMGAQKPMDLFFLTPDWLGT